MLKTIFLLLVLLLSLTETSFSKVRDITFENIGLEHGLSQLSVNCIMKDKKGFMWFGTEDGLNRYDGYGFTIYKHDPDDPASISDNHIRIICEDNEEEALWIGTKEGGLSKFNLQTETFTNYKHDPNDPRSLSHNEVYSLYRDRNGVLWVGTWGGGLNRFDKKTGTFTHYRCRRGNPSSLSHNIVRAIFEDSKGTMWIGTYGGGLNQMDRQAGTFTHYRHDPKRPGSLSNDQVIMIYETKAGELWIAADGGGGNVFDPVKGTFTCYRYNPRKPGSLSNDRVRAIHEDSRGVLWVGTYGGGLNRFDDKTRTFTTFRHDPRDLKSLGNDEVLSIYEDNTEMLWIGTKAGGVAKLDLQIKKINHYVYVPNKPNGLSSGNIRAFVEDSDGMLWVGTNGAGLNKFDREKGKVAVYVHEPKNPDSLSYDRVYALYDDKKENVLWVGTFGGGLNKMNKRTGKFTHYKHDPGTPHSVSHNRVRALCEDHTGTLWIGTWNGGLNKFDRENRRFKHYRHDPDNSYSISHDFVFCIYEDRSGVLWVGTWGGGLNRYNRKKDTFTRYQHVPNDPNSLRNNRVLCIHEDRTGILWVGSGGRGLNRFDRKNNKWSFYSTKHGLPNDVIYGILEDEKGNLWLSSNGGISRFNSKRETFKNYTTEDGLQSNEFNGGASYKSPSGEMFFGGINGFNSFYPGEIRDNPYAPPVIITDFRKFNQPVTFAKPVSEIKDIQLSYSEDFISFDFVALNYRASEKNQYAYMMEGFDKEWIYCGTRRTASYTNLDGGTYVFNVQAANNDGVWNNQGASIRITIALPYWKRWWFRAVVAIAILALVYMLYRYRTLSIRFRNKQLEEMNVKLEEQIVQRQRVEEALRRNEEEFRSIFENSIDAHYRADLKGKLLMMSPAGVKLLGYASSKEIIGKDIAQTFYYNRDDRGTFLETLKRQGIVTNYEVTLQRKDGKQVTVETNARFIYDEKNKPRAVEGILRDITQRKRAEQENLKLQEQLLTAKKMEAVGTLAGGIAHEFNNLLSTIIGNAGLLQVRLMEDLPMRKRVGVIVDASNQCATLTNQLLSFSRKQLLKLKKLNFNDLILGIESTIGLTVGDDVEVVILPDENLEPVQADSDLMIQVVMGIVHNARDAMPDGGKLTIKTEMKSAQDFHVDTPYKPWGKLVCLSFEDTGVGIEEEIIPHIFDPFFTTKPVGEGTGLELSFVYGTVQQHNGWINVDSTPGKGTTIRICLPVTSNKSEGGVP